MKLLKAYWLLLLALQSCITVQAVFNAFDIGLPEVQIDDPELFVREVVEHFDQSRAMSRFTARCQGGFVLVHALGFLYMCATIIKYLPTPEKSKGKLRGPVICGFAPALGYSLYAIPPDVMVEMDWFWGVPHFAVLVSLAVAGLRSVSEGETARQL